MNKNNSLPRVLFISSTSDLRGGAERSLLTTAEALQGLGAEIGLAVWEEGELAESFRNRNMFVATLSQAYSGAGQQDILVNPLSQQEGWSKKLGEWGQQVFERMPGLKEQWHNLMLWKRGARKETKALKRICDSFQPDILHTNCELSLLPAGCVAQEQKYVLICHIRDQTRKWFHPKHIKTLQKAQAVLLPSQFLEAWALQNKPTLTTHVLRDPVSDTCDDQAWSKQQQQQWRKRFGKKKGCSIMGMGRIEPQKRVHVVAEALTGALQEQDKKPPLQLFWAGEVIDQKYHQEIQQKLKQAGVQDNIHWLGYQERARQWLAAMDILVAPGYEEAFGRTIIEAMQEGVAVVASDSGAHPELIEHQHSGFLYPPDKIITLKETLQYLCRHPAARRAISQRGQEAAQGQFAPPEVGQRLLAVYEKQL